ncbi:TPA: hypothetical protein ACGOYV_001644 [Streptococcus suis]
MINGTKTGNKSFIERKYDSKVNGFTLETEIKIYDLFDVEYVDSNGRKFWAVESEIVDEFEMTEAEIERDYEYRAQMWEDIEKIYEITNPKFLQKVPA